MMLRAGTVLNTVFVLAIACSVSVGQEDDLAKRATWETPTAEQIKLQLDKWIETQPATDEVKTRAAQAWFDGESLPNLDRVGSVVAIVSPEARKVVDYVTSSQTQLRIADFPWLSTKEVAEDQPVAADFARSNLRLMYGRWLSTRHFYNESLDQLADLELDEVVDPPTLLFYRSVAWHRLLDKENCLTEIERLMENESLIPKRYSTVARLMQADLQPLEPDSLDEISRLMSNIEVRLGHARAGKRVRKEEDDVIAKLDKMIEEAEKQQQQQQQQSSGSAGGSSPFSPMQDSMQGGGNGPGDVDSKKLKKEKSWGNLPPKEREAALQQLSKDLPSHARDVIEGYFRKLARDQKDSGQR